MIKHLPTFNYCNNIIEHPEVKKLCTTSTPMWMLHHKLYNAHGITSLHSHHYEAMINFKCWQMSFEQSSSDTVNRNGNDLTCEEVQILNQTIVQCVFFAELQDWRLFMEPELLNN